MKRNTSKSAILTLFALTGKCFAQTVTSGTPGVVYQNPSIYPTAQPVYATPATPTYTTTAPTNTAATPTYTDNSYTYSSCLYSDV